MQINLIEKREVLNVINDLFLEEIEALKLRTVNEQYIIGNKLTVIEIELKKLVKSLPIFTGIENHPVELGKTDERGMKIQQENQIKSDVAK